MKYGWVSFLTQWAQALCSSMLSVVLHKHHWAVLYIQFVNTAFQRKWSHSVVSDSAAPWTVARQAPLSVGFSRQEYWSGLLFPSPGDLPNPGIKPWSLALQANALSSEPPGKLPKFEQPYYILKMQYYLLGIIIWEEIPFPGYLSDPRIEPRSPALPGRFSTIWAIYQLTPITVQIWTLNM